MRLANAALALGGLVVALAFILQVTDAEPRMTGGTGTRPIHNVVEVPASGGRVCQDGEVLPAGTELIRAWIWTYAAPGPAIDVEVVHDGRVVARGSLDGGWREGAPVYVPISPGPAVTLPGATVCMTSREPMRLVYQGDRLPPVATVDGVAQPGRASFVYMTEPKGLAAMAGTIAGRYGRGTAAFLGSWTVVLMGLLLLGAVAAAALTLRAAAGGMRTAGAPQGARGWRRIPRVARFAALTGLLTGTVWALLVPPFHVPDEMSHVAYVQLVAEAGKLPHEGDGSEPFSDQQRSVMSAVRFFAVFGNRDARPLWTAEEEAALRATESAEQARDNGTDASAASSNPPLYYLLAAAPYRLTPSTDLLDRMYAMRLLSVLLGALTVLAGTLFVRELLPGSPWTWAAGGLALAFQPVFGFISAGVSSDSLLFAMSAVTLMLAARLARRGFTRRRAIALALAVAAGVLSKPVFLGLVPAVALLTLIAAARAGHPLRERLASLAVAAGVAVAPVVLYQVVGSLAFDHPYFTSGTTVGTLAGGGGGGAPPESFRDMVSYVWQLFLPRLPFMQEQFPGGLPLRFLWFEGAYGRLGWLDYSPGHLSNLWGLRIAAGIGILALVSLAVHARRLGPRVLELGCYVLAAAGVAAVVGMQDYRAHTIGGAPIQQARYLFPLLALYAGVVAVAVRLAGRRAGPPAAVAFATLALVHMTAMITLTVARYYA